MKQKHMFSLLDQTFTTVHVAFPSYNPDDIQAVAPAQHHQPKAPQPPMPKRAWGGSQGTYVYKVPFSWGVNEGDELLVETGIGLVITNVVKVDGMPDIDVDANFDYKWAVQKVDRTKHNELVDSEKRFADSLLEIERVKQRESLLTSFRESLPEGSAARNLFEQTTAQLQAPPPPQAPPVAPAAPSVDAAK